MRHRQAGRYVGMPLAAGLFIILGHATHVHGCGSDTTLSDGFGALHPRAITVAFAVRDAIDTGLLDEAILSPTPSEKPDCARASTRLSELRRRLSAATTARGSAPGPISILLIDSHLSARLSPTSVGYDVAMHTKRAETGDVVIITHESVLAAIVERRLLFETALYRRLLVVEGEPGTAAAVARALTELVK